MPDGGRRIPIYVVVAAVIYGAFEVVMFGALLVVDWALDFRYSYTLTTALSDHHRRLLNRVLDGDAPYLTFSPTLGWTVKPSGRTPLYRANSQGIRADREYDRTPVQVIVRLAAFGDSFTHGDGVGNEGTWEHLLETANPGLEVLNFGVGGFGLDQAFLRYQEVGVGYRAHVVLIGFMVHDLDRNVSMFRPFLNPKTGVPFAKPRFKAVNGALTLIENPMRDLSAYRELLDRPQDVLPLLGADDYFYAFRYPPLALDFLPSVRALAMGRYFARSTLSNDTRRSGYLNVDSEAFMVTRAIFDEFVRSVKENGSVPLILLFPWREDVVRYRRDGTKTYQPLMRYLRTAGYAFVDLMDGFEGRGGNFTIEELFVGHYSALGNSIVAEHLAQALRERALIDGS